jgi:phenylacetate-coenzyme A ligase PaaK-like adenylate-forming protein
MRIFSDGSAEKLSPVTKWLADKTGLSDLLSPESLKSWQQEKLKTVIDYARHNTRFYGKKPGSETELSELPFTFPSDLAREPLAFLAIPPHEAARVTTHANSGTTALCKRVFFSGGDLERTREFFTIGMSGIVDSGDKVQILISNETENSLGRLLAESLVEPGVKSEISGTIKNVHQAIEVSRNADCLVGMPAEILYMSRIAPEMRPRSVLLTADITPQPAAQQIRDSWKCDVFTHYGHTEFGYGCAVDCRYHNGLHLRDADLVFEVIDSQTGRPARPGESGEITITTLSNEAMPLIRYRTGNIARMLTEPCRCGSPLHRLGAVEGRIQDNITVSGGNTINICRLDTMIFENPAVRCYNAIFHKDKNVLRLIVDSDTGIDQGELSARLPDELKVEVKYAAVDPFFQRQKRRIAII